MCIGQKNLRFSMLRQISKNCVRKLILWPEVGWAFVCSWRHRVIFFIHVFLRFLHCKAICDVKPGIDQYLLKLTHGSKMTVSSFLLKIMWPNLSWKGWDMYLIKVDRFMWRNEKHLRKCYVLLMRKKKVRIDIVGVSINCGLKWYTWNFFFLWGAVHLFS